MIINGRLLLLAVVIGIFVQLWSPAGTPRVRPVTRSRPVVTYPAPTLVSSVNAMPEPVVLSSEGNTPSVTPTGEPRWTNSSSPIALPAGIAPGEYRVVSDAGEVARLTVTDDDRLEVTAPSTAQMEFYVTSADQTRWYFIRLHSSPVQETGIDSASAAAETLLPDFEPVVAVEPVEPFEADPLPAPRKFDFGGYVPAASIEAPVIEQAARPRPPELPTAY